VTSTSREFAATYPPPSRMAHNMVTDAGARSNPRLNVRVTQKALHTTHIATRCYQGHATCKLQAWRGRSLAHSNEALKRCCGSIAPGATPGLLHRKLLPVSWASVAGRGRHALTSPASHKVCILALPERWGRRLVDHPASTVLERCRVLAPVWKLSHCPLRGHPLVSFAVPSVDSVAPLCRRESAVADCLPNRWMQHLGTFLSPSMPRCRNDKDLESWCRGKSLSFRHLGMLGDRAVAAKTCELNQAGRDLPLIPSGLSAAPPIQAAQNWWTAWPPLKRGSEGRASFST
jgi:hypothetical protein